jgi:hypothetical protein
MKNPTFVNEKAEATSNHKKIIKKLADAPTMCARFIYQNHEKSRLTSACSSIFFTFSRAYLANHPSG